MRWLGAIIGIIVGIYLVLKLVLKYLFIVICLPGLIPLALILSKKYRFYNIELERTRWLPAFSDALHDLIVDHLHIIIGVGILILLTIAIVQIR